MPLARRSCWSGVLVLSIACSSLSETPVLDKSKLQRLSLAATSRQGRSLKLGQKHRSVSDSEDRAYSKHPETAGWFGDFSQAESTYTTEGLYASPDNPYFPTEYGRDPSVWTPESDNLKQVETSDFFHESRSGGPSAAWQTNYPNVPQDAAGNGAADDAWRQTPEGWFQDYNPVQTTGSNGVDQAAWFDNFVNQVDGYGRDKTPEAVQIIEGYAGERVPNITSDSSKKSKDKKKKKKLFLVQKARGNEVQQGRADPQKGKAAVTLRSHHQPGQPKQ